VPGKTEEPARKNPGPSHADRPANDRKTHEAKSQSSTCKHARQEDAHRFMSSILPDVHGVSTRISMRGTNSQHHTGFQASSLLKALAAAEARRAAGGSTNSEWAGAERNALPDQSPSVTSGLLRTDVQQTDTADVTSTLNCIHLWHGEKRGTDKESSLLSVRFLCFCPAFDLFLALFHRTLIPFYIGFQMH